VAENLFDIIKTDKDGLVPAVIVDYKTKEVLMVGYMNQEALRAARGASCGPRARPPGMFKRSGGSWLTVTQTPYCLRWSKSARRAMKATGAAFIARLEGTELLR